MHDTELGWARLRRAWTTLGHCTVLANWVYSKEVTLIVDDRPVVMRLIYRLGRPFSRTSQHNSVKPSPIFSSAM